MHKIHVRENAPPSLVGVAMIAKSGAVPLSKAFRVRIVLKMAQPAQFINHILRESAPKLDKRPEV